MVSTSSSTLEILVVSFGSDKWEQLITIGDINIKKNNHFMVVRSEISLVAAETFEYA